MIVILSFLEKHNIKDCRILVTGGAGFIGSNLCEFLVTNGAHVKCLDNLSTGKLSNLKSIIGHQNFEFVEGDIRDIARCDQSVKGVDYVLHHAALGSVPRSVKDPVLSNEVNVSGFLNMLVASKNANVKRFIYAASSSTYGDSESLPKIEDHIGKPLSPYAVTKYVNELYADVFFKTYGLETIGLRYFNVFGRKQDTQSTYAAVIPLFVKKFMQYESPVFNGDGTYSRDFTYIDNVIQANVNAILVTDKAAINQVYNIAYGERTDLKTLAAILKGCLADFDPKIVSVTVEEGPLRAGDIPHSLASIAKAKKLLGYNPQYSVKRGVKEVVSWYWENL